MTDGDESPALSSRVLELFYLGEAVVAGLTFYLVGFALLHLPEIIADSGYIAIMTLVLIVVLLRVAAVASNQEPVDPSPSMRAWHEARRWRVVVALGLLVGAVLFAGSVLAWGWIWPVQDALLLAMGVLVLGALLRVSGMYLGSR